MIAVGVARPIAHGHAMTSTATAVVSPYSSEGDGPKSAQPANVKAAMHENDRHEHRGHTVGEALDRCA